MIEVYEHPLENGAKLLILRGDRESDKDAINAHLDGLRIQKPVCVLEREGNGYLKVVIIGINELTFKKL